MRLVFCTLITLIICSNVNAQTEEKPWFNESFSFEKRARLLVKAMTLEEKCSQFISDAKAIQRLGVPEYNWWNESLHGVARNGKATIFPQGIAMGATFSPELIKKVASAISDEARAKFQVSQSIDNRGKYSGLTFWSPNVNLFRDPRWGRGQETYGEDPYLMAKIGVAYVQGIQGNHPKYLKAAACAKHFAVHSGPEELRHSFNAKPSKLDLYETYLPAFEALVTEAKVEGVMGAYNAVYDEPATSSKFLLNEILQDKWGFNGYIVSDCGALGDILNGHKKANSAEEAAAMAFNTGVNLNCGWVYENLKKAVEKGYVKEKFLNQQLEKLFLTRFKLGFFDKKESNPYNSLSTTVINSKKHKDLARSVAQKSIVLLKNKNNVLPLKKDIKSLYVTGAFSSSTNILMANYYGMSSNLVTVLEGVTDKVSLGTSLNYRQGVLPFTQNLNPKNWAPHVAKEVEATILVAGISNEIEGEEVDAIASEHKGDRLDLKLPQSQIDYIKQISKNKKGPLILVIGTGSAVSLEEVAPLVDAILVMWYPGEQGGNAVADVLFGDVAPSGHLPVTFPKHVSQLPAFDDYSMKGRTYKYMKKEPMYPFGFGLTYGDISLSEINTNTNQLKKDGNDLEVSLTVENDSTNALEEVLQVYLVPKDTKGFLPIYALKNFKRVVLKPKEKQKVTFTIPNENFLQTNLKGEKDWIKGTYKIMINNSLPSKRSSALGATKPSEVILELK